MTKENSNFIRTTFICLLIACVVGLIIDSLYFDWWLPAAALSYAVSKDILGIINKKELQKEYNSSKLSILKKFANNKVKESRSIIDSLASLEYIITEISNCCDAQNQKTKFMKVKGILASTKTTFDKSQFDNELTKPYNEAITSISNIETYLNDL